MVSLKVPSRITLHHLNEMRVLDMFLQRSKIIADTVAEHSQTAIFVDSWYLGFLGIARCCWYALPWIEMRVVSTFGPFI